MAKHYHHDHTQQLCRSSPLEEQVFSNPVFLEKICKHLSTQDLLRTSLLSQAWCTESRKALTDSKGKHAVCIQIDYHSPCRTLVKFNDFLGETHLTTTHPIIFNGIKLRFSGQYNPKYKCHDCLKNNWPAGDGVNDAEDGNAWTGDGRWSDERDQFIMDKLPEIFGNILGKMELKYIRLEDRLAYYCPFACLVKWWIRERPETILKLHFNNFAQDSERYILFNTLYLNSPKNLKTFPNLEVIGGRTSLFFSSKGFGLSSIIAPSLKKVAINRCTYDPATNGIYNLTGAEYRFQPNFPFHALTNLQTSAHKVKKAVTFIEEFHPKIEGVKLEGHCNPSQITRATREDLFHLGQILSATLKNLICSSSILAFLVCGRNKSDDGGSVLKNRFPALEMLELQCPIRVDGLDSLKSIDFRQHFPNLKAVGLPLVKINSAHDVSPDNSQIGGDRVEFIKRLSLSTASVNRHAIDSGINLLNLFSNISHLDLKGMPFSYDCDDGAFRRLLSKIATLVFLKEISINAPDLSSFCLDDLILKRDPEVKERLKEINLDCLLAYTSSILDHKGLQKINIRGTKICTEGLNGAGERVCYSNQNSDSFLVSSKLAKEICKHRPGFKFCLEITGACIPECTSGFRPGGLRLEHLEPFAKISTQKQPGIKFKRFWEIQFLGEERESTESYNCCVQ